MPTCSRTAATNSAIMAMPLSVNFETGKHVLGVEDVPLCQAQRMGERARRAVQQIDAEIHFQPGETFLLAPFQTLAVNFRVVRFGGIGVAADLVAKFAAEHLIYRHAISLAGEVPQRHLYAA